MNRRIFLQMSALAGGGLALGFYESPFATAQFPGAAKLSPTAFIKIAPDGIITLMAKIPEIGQGREDHAAHDDRRKNWMRIGVKFASSRPILMIRVSGGQSAGGSTTTQSNYMPMRQVGAACRQMLVSVAAKRWGVDEK